MRSLTLAEEPEVLDSPLCEGAEDASDGWTVDAGLVYCALLLYFFGINLFRVAQASPAVLMFLQMLSNFPMRSVQDESKVR